MLALVPLLAVTEAGAFASAAIMSLGLGGLWIAWKDRAFAVLAGLAALLVLTAGTAALVGGKPSEAILFATVLACALVWVRLPRLLPDGDLARARWLFAGAAIALPALLLLRAQLFHRDLIPPLSVAPDMLAKPTFVAMTLVPGVMLILWRLRLWPLALLFGAFMAFMAIGSASSTATLAFLLAMAAILAAWLRPGLGVLAAASVLLLPLVLSIGIRIVGITDWAEIGLRLSWTYRLELWQRALVLFEQAPMFGHGLDSYAHVLQTVHLGALDLGLGKSHPHSAVMQLMAEGGLTALIAFALLFTLAAVPPGPVTRDRWRTAARLGTLAAGVTGPAIGLNLWSDVTAMLVIYPLTAFALFVPSPGSAGTGRAMARPGGTAPARAATPEPAPHTPGSRPA